MGIYLDFNASTPVAPEVAARMAAVLREPFGNPSSDHWAGTAARAAVETARAQVAALLGCDAGEVIFTSGGSEANNHAINGAFFATRVKHPHIITTQVEHPAVVGPCRFLERLGAKVTYLPVDGFGRVNPDDVRQAVTPDTILISVMHASNESAPYNPLRTSAGLRGSTESFFTLTPLSQWERSRRVSESWVSISCPWWATNSMARKAWVRSMFVRVFNSSR